MSDITRRITTIFEAKGGNVLATLGGMGSGFQRAGQGARQYGRDIGYLNSQWRAFGTTFRYAIAGITTYGLAGTVSQLSQIENQLGQIAGVSRLAGITNSRGQGIRLVGESLRDMEDQVRKASIDTIQPIGSINDAILNLISTSQGLKDTEIVPIITSLSKAATLAQTPIENLTTAAAAMQTAFQTKPSAQNFNKFAAQWFTLIGLAPGLRAAGPQILTQFGPLASTMAMGRGTQEQTMALTLGALRFGGSPSTALRGLQYLVNSLTTPPSKAAREAQASIGLTPTTVQQMGIWNAIMKLLEHGRTLGMTSNVKGLASLPDEVLDDPAFRLGPQLMSGAGADFFRKAIGRIHGVRVATILESQLQHRGDVMSLVEDLARLDNRNNQMMKDYGAAWQDYLDNAKMPQAAQALRTMGVEISTQFQPIFDLVSGGITKTSEFSQTKLGHRAIWAALGGIAAIGLTRGLGLGGLARGGTRAFGAAGAFGGASGAWAGMPGESAQNPAYVWVIGQMIPPGVSKGWKLPGRGGGAVGEAEREAGTITRGRRFPTLMKYGALTGPAAVVATVLSLGGDSGSGEKVNKETLSRLSGHPFLQNAFIKWKSGQKVSPLEQQALASMKWDEWGRVKSSSIPNALSFLSASASKQMPKFLRDDLQMMSNALRGKPVSLTGQAHLTLDVNVTHPDGTKSTQRKGVDIQLFPSAFKVKTQKAPQTRGRPTTPRGAGGV